MALNAYMRITSEFDGHIEGGVTQSGLEGSILVMGMSHQVDQPFDAASGAPSGGRQHGPIIVTKEIDRATPLLMRAWADNHNLTDVDIRFWRPTPTGATEQYYTIELHDAYIAQIRAEMLNNKYPENMQHPVREHVALVYRTIIWTYEDPGIEALDGWRAPVA